MGEASRILKQWQEKDDGSGQHLPRCAFPAATCRGAPSEAPVAERWASPAEVRPHRITEGVFKAKEVLSGQVRTGFPEEMRRGEVIFQKFILAL